MKKTLLFTLMIVSILSVQAQKKVAYVTLNKTLTTTATPAPTTVQTDPIIQVLSADPNLLVTVKVIAAGDAISDLSNYDVIIVQESNGGGDATLKPTGALALKTIPKPFIYNKMYALQKSRALTSTTSTAAGKEADGTTAGTLTITIDAAALTNDLFKGCTLVNTNQIKLFNALSTDLGDISVATSVKALNYNYGVTLSGGTLLAQPSILSANTTCTVGINSFPAGTTFEGTETTLAPSIFVGMNFGAICANGGKNITSDGLTIWRNAVYILAGLSVPNTPASLPTAVNKVSESSEVVSEMYYNVNGVQVREPKNNTNGVLIKKVTYKNGIVKSTKVALINN